MPLGQVRQLLALLTLIVSAFSLNAQPLVKSVTGVNPDNSILAGATFTYQLTYNCGSTSGPCLNAQIIDLLPPEVQFLSTVPASATGDVFAINVTPNYMGSGRTRVQFLLINPLPAGNSAELRINVRFPNGTTPNGTVATNTATATNLGSSPGSFTTTPVSVTSQYTNPFTEPVVNLSLTTAPANLDIPETYRLRFSVPNSNGVGNYTAAGPVVFRLPPGTVFNGATPAADCQPGCVGTTPATVSFTAPFTTPITPGSNRDIFVNVTFPSATFTSGSTVTAFANIQATLLGEPPASFSASVSHPVTTFVPNPAAELSVNLASETPNPPTLNQTFSYNINSGNTGNVPLDNLVVIGTLPVQLQVNSVSTGAYSGVG